MLIIIFLSTAAAKLIASIILYTVKPMPPGAMQLRTRGHDFELPIIKYEFNKRNFIVQLLFKYVWFCVLLYYLHFVFYCTHVRMSYVINSYLLTYNSEDWSVLFQVVGLVHLAPFRTPLGELKRLSQNLERTSSPLFTSLDPSSMSRSHRLRRAPRRVNSCFQLFSP